ncbi:MAG: hypothetical protein WKG07_27220 [Hymenobacter sp.]
MGWQLALPADFAPVAVTYRVVGGESIIELSVISYQARKASARQLKTRN